ncbi:DUF1850 domain-containing protein [Desulfocucumis palustris]|uniref:DUF1850 domain-containing protein n=1 Tax=Desulfocucumis palustris TaxID=1898651 RepID=A0A2L2XLB7_9FIRM|nr:DUF1850 domain-containing protein [Desulfocucumis palustris]
MVAVILIVTAVLARGMLSRTVLVVRDAKTGQSLEIGPVDQGESFELHYIHSVDKLPVRDFFLCRNGGLVLEQTRCLSFGAGLGYAGQGELKGEKGWNIIDNMDRKVGTLPLRVGTIADHKIIYRGREFHLAQFFAPKSLVLIGVEHRWRF